jgi:hypothetical protein
MRLYSGSSALFIQDAYQNQIAGKLKSSFFEHFRYYPPESEIRSWKNSLRALSQVLQTANLMDHGILLEYQLPLTSKRMDCLIAGKDQEKRDRAIIVELKQWERCEEAIGENEVCTWLNGAKRDVLHPSVQVGQYQLYLEDMNTAFYEGSQPVQLSSCAFLHNYLYDENDVIFASKFVEPLRNYPIFTGDRVIQLQDYLAEKLMNGEGLDVLKRIEQSKYKPSKKLMQHVSETIRTKSQYILLDEQKIVYDVVLAHTQRGFHDRKKTVVIVKGGPGTGKSVIALNLMADLLRKGYNAHYATGSKAFTETLRQIIGTRGAIQFKYFNSYMKAGYNEIDVLICDEAHRIRKTSNNRFTKKDHLSDKAQIEELLNVSKVAVFFIDDNQVVRPDEIGSVQYIREYAERYQCNLLEYELEAQFRCNGSDGFINWVNNTLGIRKTANVIWEQGNEQFDFQIFRSPAEVEQAIRQKVTEGYNGRMTAGFCWPWSSPDGAGNLADDVVIGEYRRPWNAKPDAVKLAPGIPKAPLWAHDPNGIEQVGCVYTAQGFEFDYVGVIFGADLRFDFAEQKWIGDQTKSYDTVVKRSKVQFEELVKNTYRVLLTRGMKGCFVCFVDRDSDNFVRSRMV